MLLGCWPLRHQHLDDVYYEYVISSSSCWWWATDDVRVVVMFCCTSRNSPKIRRVSHQHYLHQMKWKELWEKNEYAMGSRVPILSGKHRPFQLFSQWIDWQREEYSSSGQTISDRITPPVQVHVNMISSVDAECFQGCVRPIELASKRHWGRGKER